MKKLTLTGEQYKEDFEILYADIGCTCFINPPCSRCTHEGHPECLNNSDDLWNEVETVNAGDNNWIAKYKAIPIDHTQTYGRA